MGKTTNIAWCDHTFNPWWGCQRVSAGCEHCYAETFSKRMGELVFGPAKTTLRRTFKDKHWTEPLKWDAEAREAGARRRVFCASMADVFEDHPGVISDRIQLWALIMATPNLDWLLLTKRPENILKMIPSPWRERAQPNVWYGTSVENADYVGRLDYLREVPAVVRFISYEPALGNVNWYGHLEGINWLIVGGESGAGARPFNTLWATNAIVECRFSGVAPFVKQLGSKPVNGAGKPLQLKSYKGDDIAEWDESLRQREWPTPGIAVVPTLAGA